MKNIEEWLNNLHPEKRLYSLSEIIQHLIKSEKIDIACSLLLDFVFVEQKIKKITPKSLILDYESVLNKTSKETEITKSLKALLLALQQSSHLLEDNRNQVASQLIGHLYGKSTIRIDEFVKTAKKNNSSVWLNPITPSLLNKQGKLIKVFTGHTNPITCVEVFKNKKQIISGTDNGVLKIWDLKSSICLKTLADEFEDGEVIAIKEISEKYILTLYSGNSKSAFKIWDIKNQSLLNRIVGKLEDIHPQIEIIQDQKYAITVGLDNDKELIVWDIPSLKPLQTLPHKYKIHTFSCLTSPKIHKKRFFNFLAQKQTDEKLTLKIISSCYKTYNSTKALIIIHEFFNEKFHYVKKFKNRVQGLKIIPQEGINQVILWSYYDVKVVNIKTGDVLAKIYALGENKNFVNVLVSKCRQKILTFKNNSVINLRDLNTGENINLFFKGPNIDITNDSYETDIVETAIIEKGVSAISCRDDGELKIWDLKDLKNTNTFQGWSSGILKVIDEKHIISTEYRYINLWDIKTSSKSKSSINHNGKVSDIKYFEKGKILISASFDKTLKIIDPRNITCIKTLTGHTNQINNVELFLRNNKYFAISTSGYFQTEGNELKVWDLSEKKCINSIVSHKKEIKKVVVIRQGYYAIAMDSDFTVKLIDLILEENVFTFEHNPQSIELNAFSQKMSKGFEDFDVKMSPSLLFPYHKFEVYNREENVIIGYFDGSLMIWDLKNQYLKARLDEHKDAITEITISEDGELALTASLDETFKLWNLNDYSCINTFEENIGVINKLMFLNIPYKYRFDIGKFDENLIKPIIKYKEPYFLTATSEAVLKLWDIKTGKCLLDFIGHSENIIFLIPFTKKTRVLSICTFGNLIIWDLLNGEQITSIALGRSITSATLAKNEEMIILGEENGQINFIRIEGSRFTSMKIV